MLRPCWLKLSAPARKLARWWSRRALCRRPGHFRIHARRLPRLRSLLTGFPWKRLLHAHPAAAAILLGAGIAGYVMIDAETVGADASAIARQVKRDRPAPPPLPEDSSMHLQGKVAMLLQVAMLQDAVNRLDQINSYTTTFEKQERLGGVLSARQVIRTKIRHEPFSVYFKFEEGDDPGREVLFPVSADDPRMLVQLTKFGGRLPALKLEPNSTLAMSEARYPITMAGIRELAAMALEIRRADLKHVDQIRTEMRDDRTFDGRPVYSFTIEYASPEVSASYRRCELDIDKQLMVPVRVRNWTWLDKVPGADRDALDESTLIEFYAFRDIRIDAELKPEDFTRSNPEYRFR